MFDGIFKGKHWGGENMKTLTEFLEEKYPDILREYILEEMGLTLCVPNDEWKKVHSYCVS